MLDIINVTGEGQLAAAKVCRPQRGPSNYFFPLFDEEAGFVGGPPGPGLAAGALGRQPLENLSGVSGFGFCSSAIIT